MMFSRINRAFKKSRAEDEFTLIELLIVIVIIGILAAIAIPVFLNQQNAAHDASVKSNARNTVIGVAAGLVTKPDATSFMVLAPSDTIAAVKLAGVPSVIVTVPTGAVAVRAVVTQSNWVTVRGTGADYLVHAQSTIDGFWYEFSSKTGKYTSSTDNPPATPKVPSSKDPVPNSVKNPDGTPVRVPGDPVTTTTDPGTGTGGTGGGVSTASWGWTKRISAQSSWQSLASSADGTKLIAAEGSVAVLYTSADSGAHWAEALRLGVDQNGNGAHWQGVASSANGSKLVATTNTNGVYTSADSGATWTQQVTTTQTAARALVASSADGIKLIRSYGTDVFTSTDSGVTWTPSLVGGGTVVLSVTSSGDGTKLIATTIGSIYISADSGATWNVPSTDEINPDGTHTTDTLDGSYSAAVSTDGSLMVAKTKYSNVVTSADSGVTWTHRAYLGTYSLDHFASSANGSLLFAADENGFLYISNDYGDTWVEQTAPGGNNGWHAIAMSADGKKLIGSDYGSDIWTGVFQ